MKNRNAPEVKLAAIYFAADREGYGRHIAKPKDDETQVRLTGIFGDTAAKVVNRLGLPEGAHAYDTDRQALTIRMEEVSTREISGILAFGQMLTSADTHGRAFRALVRAAGARDDEAMLGTFLDEAMDAAKRQGNDDSELATILDMGGALCVGVQEKLGQFLSWDEFETGLSRMATSRWRGNQDHIEHVQAQAKKTKNPASTPPPTAPA